MTRYLFQKVLDTTRVSLNKLLRVSRGCPSNCFMSLEEAIRTLRSDRNRRRRVEAARCIASQLETLEDIGWRMDPLVQHRNAAAQRSNAAIVSSVILAFRQASKTEIEDAAELFHKTAASEAIRAALFELASSTSALNAQDTNNRRPPNPSSIFLWLKRLRKSLTSVTSLVHQLKGPASKEAAQAIDERGKTDEVAKNLAIEIVKEAKYVVSSTCSNEARAVSLSTGVLRPDGVSSELHINLVAVLRLKNLSTCEGSLPVLRSAMWPGNEAATRKAAWVTLGVLSGYRAFPGEAPRVLEFPDNWSMKRMLLEWFEDYFRFYELERPGPARFYTLEEPECFGLLVVFHVFEHHRAHYEEETKSTLSRFLAHSPVAGPVSYDGGRVVIDRARELLSAL